MKILYLSQLIPYPLDAGPKVRQYYVLRYLVEAGHEVILVAFSRASDTPEAIDHVWSLCSAVYCVPIARSKLRDLASFARSLFTATPFLITRDSSPAMAETIDNLVQSQDFDVIHADQLWMASYALRALAECPPDKKPKLVLDQHNATYLIPQRLAAGHRNLLYKVVLAREARLMEQFEREMCRKFDSVVWVTDEDRQAVTGGMSLPAQEFVIPICVDPERQPLIERIPEPFRITFLGGLHWPPNANGIIWFVREVWPQIIAECPGAVLTVIGKNPPAHLGGSGNTPVAGLDVTGYVVDLEPYLAETAVFIVPLHAAGGMRVKILDAWCWGLPVVATTIGAEGTKYRDLENILIADDPVRFAQAVGRIWRDPALADHLRNEGRHTIEAHYDWRAVYPAWDFVYTSAPKKDLSGRPK